MSVFRKCTKCDVIFAKDISFCPLCGGLLSHCEPNLSIAQYTFKEIKRGEIEITSYNGPDADINVPSSINGMTVVSIGKYAFANRNGIRSVILPETVKVIKCDAFYNSSLTSIVLPNSIQSIGVADDDSLSGYIFNNEGHGAFEASRITSVTIPPSVKEIFPRAFAKCPLLSSVKFECNIKSIPESCFQECRRLTTLDLPNSIQSIEEKAFESSGLTTIKIPGSTKEIGSSCFRNCTRLSSVFLGNGIEEISSGAFLNCSSLYKIAIPASVKKMDATAFQITHEYTSNTWAGPYGWMPEKRSCIDRTIKLYCQPGSYAMVFAASNNLDYDSIENWGS